MASLERFAAACLRSGERCALACASLAYGGSLAYGARGGAALCEASKEPPKEAAPPEPEHGGERYLAYSASLARLKVVLLKTKLAIAKTTLAKGAALKTAAAGKAAAVKTAAAEGARYVAYSSDVGESMRPVLKPWMVTATYGVAVGYVCYDAGSDPRANRRFDPTSIVRRAHFGRASRTRREHSIRPKVTRIDFDAAERENFDVPAHRSIRTQAATCAGSSSWATTRTCSRRRRPTSSRSTPSCPSPSPPS